MHKINNTKENFERIRNGNKQLRERLILDNLNLAYKLASGYIGHKGIDFETAKQQAAMGLIKAVDTFDPNRGAKFSTYAYMMIMSEIKKFIRDNREDIPCRISRRDYQLYINIYKAKDKFNNELTCEEDYSKMAEYLQTDPKDIKKIVVLMENSGSMDKAMYRDKNGEDKITLKEAVIDRINLSENQIVDKIVLNDAIKQLNEREREVINLKYYQDKTQDEIGKIIGKSQVTISRTENSALSKLNKILQGQNITKKKYKTKYQMEVNDYNLSLLTERQKQIALLLFKENKTQNEAAEELGVTKSTISTVVLDIKNKIRNAEVLV